MVRSATTIRGDGFGPRPFLAGAVILNVLKEELPEEQESRLSYFMAGAAVYSAVMLAL